MKWKVLTTAPNQLTAEIWCEILKEEGITATIKPGDAVSFLGVSPFSCRVMVPEDMMAEAEEVLADYVNHSDESYGDTDDE